MKINDHCLKELTIENSALLMVDYQVGINFNYGTQTNLKFSNVAQELVKSAKNFNIPILISDSYPQGQDVYTINWLSNLCLNQKVYHRNSVLDAFSYKPFADAIAALGRKKLILIGVTEELCAVFPVRTAIKLGYEVILCYDIAGAADKMDMIATILRVQQMGAIVAPGYSIAANWQKNSTLPAVTSLSNNFSEPLVNYEFVAQSKQGMTKAPNGRFHS